MTKQADLKKALELSEQLNDHDRFIRFVEPTTLNAAYFELKLPHMSQPVSLANYVDTLTFAHSLLKLAHEKRASIASELEALGVEVPVFEPTPNCWPEGGV